MSIRFFNENLGTFNLQADGFDDFIKTNFKWVNDGVDILTIEKIIRSFFLINTPVVQDDIVYKALYPLSTEESKKFLFDKGESASRSIAEAFNPNPNMDIVYEKNFGLSKRIGPVFEDLIRIINLRHEYECNMDLSSIDSYIELVENGLFKQYGPVDLYHNSDNFEEISRELIRRGIWKLDYMQDFFDIANCELDNINDVLQIKSFVEKENTSGIRFQIGPYGESIKNYIEECRHNENPIDIENYVIDAIIKSYSDPHYLRDDLHRFIEAGPDLSSVKILVEYLGKTEVLESYIKNQTPMSKEVLDYLRTDISLEKLPEENILFALGHDQVHTAAVAFNHLKMYGSKI